MIIVASTNGDVGIHEVMGVMKAGGSAVDSVQRICVPTKMRWGDERLRQ